MYVLTVRRYVVIIDRPMDINAHFVLGPFIALSVGSSMLLLGAYDFLRFRSVAHYSWIIIRALVLGLALVFFVFFIFKVQYVSRLSLMVFAVLAGVAMLAIRALLHWWYCIHKQELASEYLSILIVGTGSRAIRLQRKLKMESEWGISIVGHVDLDPSLVGTYVLDEPVIGCVPDVPRILKENVVDEVILAVPRRQIEEVSSIAIACSEEGVKLRVLGDIYDIAGAKIGLDSIDNVPLLTFEPVPHDESTLLAKRFFDLIFVMAITPLVLPVMLLVAAVVKIDSPGPVFFRHARVGLHKRRFEMIKFRTMCEGSDQMLASLESQNEAEGPIFKIVEDPRITRIGRFLRRTSLDELPQFINILQGYMSLVGPRPMSVRDVSRFDRSIQRKRFSVRPGLTCLWQISGRSDLPFDKWLELDLKYIASWSLTLDMKILIKTLPAVVRGNGAY